MNGDEKVLVVTGCISPNPRTPQLKLKDDIFRKKQYIESLRFYIENAKIDNIVYCDNSGASVDSELASLAERRGKRFEWISFYGDTDKTIAYGKGYGECEIMKYVLIHSELVKRSNYLIKVTGRLIVRNINLLMRLSGKNVCFCPNKTEDHRLYINTRIYMMPIETFKRDFQGAINYINDNNKIYLEHAFGICVVNNSVSFKKFMIAPWIEGISGSTGREYKPTFWAFIKDNIKLRMYRFKKDCKGN